MLSELKQLTHQADGRYATDLELEFISDYVQSYALRLQTYQKLQALEATLVQQTYAKMQAIDPTLFRSGNEDVSAKWKRDTIRVLRYTALAVLLDDAETLRERLLFWLQTVMRAFGAQRSCAITYEVLQAVVKQHLTAQQSSLVCPMLSLNQMALGNQP